MPNPPPSIIAGPPIPIFDPSVAIITSQQASNEAFPAKQRPAVIPTIGTSPLKVEKEAKVELPPAA